MPADAKAESDHVVDPLHVAPGGELLRPACAIGDKHTVGEELVVVLNLQVVYVLA
jgi:hypothetical protein